MTIQEINDYISRNELPPVSKCPDIKKLINKYPYFQEPIFIYLKTLYLAKDETFRTEQQRLSGLISDKKALFYYILSSEYEKFFAQKRNSKNIDKSRTDILLNAFFETFDDSDISLQIEKTIGGPGMIHSDYFSFIETESEKPDLEEKTKPMKHQSIIDDFINNSKDNQSIKFSLENGKETDNPQIKEKSEEELNEELQDDLFFTQTLANIYIKQQKYERAYEIIKRLNLNYPEKNIYFANQISFLEKLIINKQHKK